MIRAFSPKGSPGFSFQSFLVPQKGFPLQSLTQIITEKLERPYQIMREK